MSKNSTVASAKSVKIVQMFLQILWYLGWVAVIIQLSLLVAVSFSDFRIKYVHLPIDVSYQSSDSEPVASPLTSPSSMPITGFSDLVVEAEMMDDYQGIVLLIPTLLLAGYMIIVLQLRRFLQTVRDGNPFISENPRRLRLIGWLVTLGAPLMGFLNHIYGRVFVHLVEIPEATLEVSKDVYPFVIFVGLIILVIAHVFDIGVKLQEEQNLTV